VPLISETVQQPRISVVRYYVSHKKIILIFCSFFPKFYRGQKVRNVASIFHFSRLWSTLVYKQTNIRKSKTCLRSLDGVNPHFFHLSNLVSPLFFVNSPTKYFFRSGVTPWRVSPGAVRRSPSVNTQTFWFSSDELE